MKILTTGMEIPATIMSNAPVMTPQMCCLLVVQTIAKPTSVPYHMYHAYHICRKRGGGAEKKMQ